MNGEVMTMATLYHMCRMEYKDIDAHDVLKISICDPTDPQLKLGIKAVYKESKDREEETQESSSKSQSKVGEEDIEEEVASVPVHVATWYNKTLRPPHLDLSFFEVEKDANEDIADVDEKVNKYYRIGDTNDRNWMCL
uniref:Uncharacterized protein n=1 Tax=Kalanchoe fedtschenkoi TaxID=63787 RepID=A0A7N0VJG7_KALFE